MTAQRAYAPETKGVPEDAESHDARKPFLTLSLIAFRSCLQSLVDGAEAECGAAQEDRRLALQQVDSRDARIADLTAQLDRCAFDAQQLRQACDQAASARDDALKERDAAARAGEEAEGRARDLALEFDESRKALQERDAREVQKEESAHQEREAMGQEMERARAERDRALVEVERLQQDGEERARTLEQERLLTQVRIVESVSDSLGKISTFGAQRVNIPLGDYWHQSWVQPSQRIVVRAYCCTLLIAVRHRDVGLFCSGTKRLFILRLASLRV